MSATPEAAVVLRATELVSIPSPSRSARRWRPKSSSPSAPNIAVGAPERAAAIAWLAPLPPPKMAKEDPVTVSPASGALATRATRSVLIAPATKTGPGAGSPERVTAADLPDSGAGGRRWRSLADLARHHLRRARRRRPVGD